MHTNVYVSENRRSISWVSLEPEPYWLGYVGDSHMAPNLGPYPLLSHLFGVNSLGPNLLVYGV